MGLFCEKLRIKIGNYLNNLKNVSTTTNIVEPNNVKNIILLCDISTKNMQQAINDFKTKIKLICPNSSIVLINFCNKKYRIDNAMISDNNIEYITEDDFSFFFKINNKALNDYLNNNYDIAIYFSCEKHIYLHFLFNYIKSPLKIGHIRTDNNMFNIIINTENTDILKFGEHIVNNYKMLFANKYK